jgi:hypothetical protein
VPEGSLALTEPVGDPLVSEWDPDSEAQGSGMAQGRRSRLIIRKVDPWTILKFSALIYLAMYVILLVAGVVLWTVASVSGVRGQIESFVGELIASEEFRFDASQLLRSSVIGGAILVVAGTCANVLMAVIFNLISDLVGGIGITVEEKVRRRGDQQRDRDGAGRQHTARS